MKIALIRTVRLRTPSIAALGSCLEYSTLPTNRTMAYVVIFGRITSPVAQRWLATCARYEEPNSYTRYTMPVFPVRGSPPIIYFRTGLGL